MPPNQSGSLFFNFGYIFIIFFIFYFLVLRPQKQKEKEHQKQIQELKKNDEIVTIGGIHGTIINVKEKTFIVRIDDNTKIEIEKSSVSRITKAQ